MLSECENKMSRIESIKTAYYILVAHILTLKSNFNNTKASVISGVMSISV